jgi:hypothetical protein
MGTMRIAQTWEIGVAEVFLSHTTSGYPVTLIHHVPVYLPLNSQWH